MRTNSYGQPIGDVVADAEPRCFPQHTSMVGRSVRLEPLDPDAHATALWDAWAEAPDDRSWTYLGVERPANAHACRAWLRRFAACADPQVYALVDAHGPAGIAAYLRIDPANAVIEVGHLNFAPRLSRTRAATEAMYLMMARAFDALRYRRYEWKCDAHNAASRQAAERLGFRFEGVFRQAAITKGRSRDTAWYSILDGEWPALSARLLRWLDDANFDAAGLQRLSLRALAGD